MVKIFFDVILNIIATFVQAVTFPINVIINGLMPNISSKIQELTNSFSTMFDGLTWGLGILPQIFISTLIFILSLELIKISVYQGTHIITRLYKIIQKIKFW